jgi:hypothetical protein
MTPLVYICVIREQEEEQMLQEEYEQECLENYPLTWELDEYELDHLYGSNACDRQKE